jgi:hypothetical protein
MKTKTHFTFRVDTWDDPGVSIVEHVAGVTTSRWQRRPIGQPSSVGQRPGSSGLRNGVMLAPSGSSPILPSGVS